LAGHIPQAGGGLRAVLSLCLLLLPVFCASPGRVEPDGTAAIRGIPFFSQEVYQCGPTALATVMDYWYGKTGKGTWVTPEQIAADIYSPSARGVLGFDLEHYARMHAFQTDQYEGSVHDLHRRVDEGVPVIVFVDYGFSVYERNHFMVVTGYTEHGVIVNSGKRESQAISEGELEKIWKKNRYWSLALKPSP
jgi:predicted double-glycine peptidase